MVDELCSAGVEEEAELLGTGKKFVGEKRKEVMGEILMERKERNTMGG